LKIGLKFVYILIFYHFILRAAIAIKTLIMEDLSKKVPKKKPETDDKEKFTGENLQKMR